MVKYRKFRDILLEDLRDKAYAQIYLMVALEEYEKDNNINAFLEALRDVTEAQGGFTQLSQRTGLNRPHLYKALSPEGNPSLFNVNKILHGFGLRLAITSLAEPTRDVKFGTIASRLKDQTSMVAGFGTFGRDGHKHEKTSGSTRKSGRGKSKTDT